jgi:nicotinamidase/pyrazinamidase
MEQRWAAIITDIQGDFTLWKNGSLAVQGTDEAFVKSVESATRNLKAHGFYVVATQDWHPPDHVSFAVNHPGKKPFDAVTINGRTQVLWPPHCVQGTENARVLIDGNLFSAVVKKGADARFESYSAFRDDGGSATGLGELLRSHGINAVVVYGIATDYCVKATALDTARAGFAVVVVASLCRGVAADSAAQALGQMREAGVAVIEPFDLEAILAFTPWPRCRQRQCRPRVS